MVNSSDRVFDYAIEFARVLVKDLNTEILSDQGDENGAVTFAKAFRWHAARVCENYEELGSLLLLELYEDQLVGKSVDKKSLHRILTRIRKRLARRIRGQQLTMEDEISTPSNPAKQTLAEAIQELAPDEAIVAKTLLDQSDEMIVISQLQISRASFYRLRKRVKEKLKRILESPT